MLTPTQAIKIMEGTGEKNFNVHMVIIDYGHLVRQQFV